VKDLIGDGMLEAPAVPYVTNTLTIMVPKANPAKITGLADLGKPNVRLAMPNPEFEGIARSVDSPGFTADIISKAPPIETGALQLSWQLVCKLA